MLVDLTTFLSPRLYVMDAVIAMEGNGPRTGKPKKLGLLLFSCDPVALDSTACRIIGLAPEFVPTLSAGESAGLGRYRSEEIEVVGERADLLVDMSFEAERTRVVSTKGNFLWRLLKNRIIQRPVIDQVLCTSCGTCVEICPVDSKAVDWIDGDRSRPPAYNYGRCLRCFCCHEACPVGAIAARDRLLGKGYRKLDALNRALARPWMPEILRR
jgi:Pyruvate/2-oxoacid:ferredoxin oxidoreductase delta subunit